LLHPSLIFFLQLFSTHAIPQASQNQAEKKPKKRQSAIRVRAWKKEKSMELIMTFVGETVAMERDHGKLNVLVAS